MRESACHLTTAVAIVTLSFLSPFSLTAQAIWVDRSHNKTIMVEFLKPNLPGGFYDDTTFPTSTMFFSVNLPISDQLNLVGELPLAHAGVEYSFGNIGFKESDTGIGNPYIGLEIHGEHPGFFTEIGARAPLASDNKMAIALALLTDFVDRGEAFLPEVLTVIAAQNYGYRAASGFTLRLRSGPSLWINTGDTNSNTDPEMFLLYSAQTGYESGSFSLMGGVSGRMIVTESDIDFGERTLHQFGAFASFDLGRVRPGAQIRLPLDDDFKGLLDSAIGVNLAVEFD